MTESTVNEPRNEGRSVTIGLPVRYEIVSRSGNVSDLKFKSRKAAADYAGECFPDQEQDPERTGMGWDVQVVGVH